MDPRALALLRSLEEWLPYEIAWERAATISGPLLLLEGARAGSIPPSAQDPERAIREGLHDAQAMKGYTCSGARIAKAARAWRSACALRSDRRTRP